VQVVATADRGEAVVGLVAQHRPDVVLLDISLPDVDGITVGLQLRRRDAVPLVFMTMHDDDATIRDVRRVRAEGFVHKADPPEQVLMAVHAVAEGRTYASRHVAQRMARALPGTLRPDAPAAPPPEAAPPVLATLDDPDGNLDEVLGRLDELGQSPSQRRRLRSALADRRDRLAELRAPFEQLTPREQHVLDGLVRGLSAPAIARDAMVSATTVRSQIRAILLKLDVHSQLEAVSLARRARWPNTLVHR
jgi:DNA-binding NarL/FixJ family response regulator